METLLAVGVIGSEPPAVSNHPPVNRSSSIGHAAVYGTVVGFVVILSIVSSVALAAGGGLMSALGVGAFAALWGGPGWGGIVGAVRYADRIAEDERNAARRAEAARRSRPVVTPPMDRPAARDSEENTDEPAVP